MRIALTGTVGSGKSGVAAILAGFMQAESIDSDQICRDLMSKGQSGWIETARRWPRFFSADGNLDRVMLREEVFRSSEIRNGLEDILHPLVRAEVTVRTSKAIEEQRPIIVEVPLLFEANWEHDFEYVVAVYAPRELSIERTARRDGVSREQVVSILDLQLSPEQKAERSDSVINNSGIWAATVLQVSRLSGILQPTGSGKKSKRNPALKA